MLAEQPVEAWREVASKCERNCHRGFAGIQVVEVVHVSSSSFLSGAKHGDDLRKLGRVKRRFLNFVRR